MIESGSPEKLREFTPARYITPFLLLVVADAGARRAPLGERPVLFWVFAAVAVLGAVVTVLRLRRMGGAHRRRPLPGWTRLLGALLAAYGLYVVCRVAGGLGA
jgi:hypothetical protein